MKTHKPKLISFCKTSAVRDEERCCHILRNKLTALVEEHTYIHTYIHISYLKWPNVS